MRVAIPIFQNRISPVFDWCRDLLLLDTPLDPNGERRQLRIDALDPPQRVERLLELGVELLVCAGISTFLLSAIESIGIRVISGVAGPIDDVIKDISDNGFVGSDFAMPGCRGHGRGPGPGPFYGGYGGRGNGSGGGKGRGGGRGWGGGRGGGKGRKNRA